VNCPKENTVVVNLGERSYTIHVSDGLVNRLSELILIRLHGVTGCAIVTNEIVDNLYGKKVEASLSPLKPFKIVIPDGEEAKTWAQTERVVGELLLGGLDRKGVVVAVGGGSVGDLAGFAASIYLRGISIVYLPTTLLGMVDSGIGGKTAVNHPLGKNLIGTFHQPSLVACDIGLLRSLPMTELRSGFAEVVKYGVIADSGLFKLIEEQESRLLKAESTVITEIVGRCAAIKSRFIEQDEHDLKGIRAALNYGHTVGHAIETLTTHVVRHGEAVAMGMIIASRIALDLGILKDRDFERQEHLLKVIGLETRLPPIEPKLMLDALHRDKKAEAGRILFILPTGIGAPPKLRIISDDIILKVLEE
jgi:3-dehydroquinate synthase